MSEQEKSSGGVAGRTSPMVVVETASSRRSVPFKPTELQDLAAPDLHQKCAPAVSAAVPENLKASTDISDNKDLRGSEYETASDRHKHVAKKLSSNVSNAKRESAPPVAIPLELIEPELKESSAVTTAQPTSTIITPIPATDTKTDISEDKTDIDSITSDITELRSPETVKKSRDWENGSYVLDDHYQEDVEESVPLQRKLATEILNNNFILNEESPIEPSTSSEFKKKEISWSDETYLEKVPLQDLRVRSATWMLERKASVGPCYRRTMPFGEPSGITICLPQRSSRNLNMMQNDCVPVKSGISITMSKRCSNSRLKPFEGFEFEMRRVNVDSELKLESGVKIKQESYSNHYSNLREKMDNLYGRIKSVLHM